MFRHPWRLAALLLLVLGFPVLAADKAPTREQSLKALDQPSAAARRAAVQRLGEVGNMADADRLVPRLHDTDERVRLLASVAMWQIWGRSGDRSIDALYSKGLQQMEMARMDEALDTFSEIIRRKPGFAEAWNKRATIYYLLGEFELSLKDCDEVIKRNANHFGALSGYGQIYLNLGDFQRALDYFQRALKVNPNLPGASTTIQMLQQQLQDKPRTTI